MRPNDLAGELIALIVCIAIAALNAIGEQGLETISRVWQSRLMLNRLIFALGAFLSATPGEAGERLSAAEINALAPGVYVGTWKETKQLNLTLNPDGTVSGTMDGEYHAGSWYLSGDELCIVFRVMVLEKTRCGAIHREGDWLVGYFKDGKPRIRLRRG